MIKLKDILREGKTVSIFGGGDSALDWAMELQKLSKVNLDHRRDDFRGAQATVDKVKQIAKDGKITLFTKFQMTAIKGEKKLETIEITSDDKEVKTLSTIFRDEFFW